jgi:hypothetical protein
MGKGKRRRNALKEVSLETCAIGKGGEFKRVQKRCEKLTAGQAAQSSVLLDKAVAEAATQQDPLGMQGISGTVGGEGKGMSTTTIIAIAGGGILVLGVAAYFILSKD